MTEILKEYTMHKDDKNRVTLRGTDFNYYHAYVYKNGCILLEPRILKKPAGISTTSYEILCESMENLKIGNVSDPLDLSEFE